MQNKILMFFLFIFSSVSFCVSSFALSEKITPKVFFEKHCSEFKAGDRQKLYKYLHENFGDPLKLVCDFDTELTNGDYRTQQTRVGLIKKLNRKKVLFFGFEEWGTKEQSTEEICRHGGASSSCRDLKSHLHRFWARRRLHGEKVANGGCVDLNYLESINCDRDDFDNFLTSENVNIRYVAHQTYPCSDETGGNLEYSFHRILDRSLMSAHYRYRELEINCESPPKSLTAEMIEEVNDGSSENLGVISPKKP